MRRSFIRIVPAAILACVAVACSGGQDGHDPEETGLVDAIADSDVDSSIDAPADSSVETAVDSGAPDTTVAVDTAEASVDAPPAACPGTAITLTGTGSAPRVASISGDTSTLSSSSVVASSCGGGSSPELVYTFTSDVLGMATLKLAAGYPAVLALRTTCDDAMTESACETRSSPGDTKIDFLASAGATYSVIVDGVGGSSGPFALDVSIAPSSCGNGKAESPEQCDDGNTVSGDGCSSTCAIEATGKLDQCPGLGYSFSGSTTSARTISFTGDTTALSSTLSSSSCTATSGNNAIHAITPDVDGSLTLELRANFANSALYVRRECAIAGQEADCAQTPTALVPTKLTIPVRKGATVWAVVDGTGKGAYVLNATLTPASCGNKVLDGGEDCDDGNTATGDGCTPTCKSEPLGAEKCASAETLALTAQTDGSYTGARAGSTVGMGDEFPACGTTATPSGQGDAVFRIDAPIDGFITATLAPEFYATLDLRKACKDATAPGSDRIVCQKSVGTDKTIASGPVRAGTSYYVIVDGNGSTPNAAGPFGLDVKITPAVCGNGIIEGAETCDDGGTDAGDGCSATCTLETVGAGSTCANPKVIATADDGSGTYRGNLKFGTTNLNATGNLGTGCTSSGKEAYLSVTAPMNGVLVADVKNATFDVSLGARSPCSTSGDTNKLTCSNKSSDGSEHIAFPVESGKTYFIIVDGVKSTDFGKFDIDVAIGPQKCGDGVVAGEECDDGNVIAGDGCSATCTLETLSGLSSCPGYAISLTGTGTTPRRAQRTISTAKLSGTTSGSCGGSGRDGTIAVTSDVSGVLRAQLTAPWSTVLYARSSCTDPTTELACNADNPSSSVDVVRDITFAVTAGVPVYLFVDGLLGDSGTATLDISVTP